ncbi:MAG TPA: globin family protein [Kamptonema sp.]|nr:globin family protein [Kamptonema sp.]
MSLNVELLEQSFNRIKPNATKFSASFYEYLFADNPEVQPLFANTNMAEQKKKLIDSLVLVVENLRKPEALTAALKGLGARHVQYGVYPTDYPFVGSALLKAFESNLGADWTPEVKQAWVDAYGAIASLMLEGADYPEEVLKLPN